MNEVTVNQDQRLFVIPCHSIKGKISGYSCLGFDVCERKTVALARELVALDVKLPFDCPAVMGTIERYKQYQQLVEIVREMHTATGFRSKTELTPQLIGLEGKRVEVVDGFGEKKRFRVGKSTGWIPCHLEIKTSRSSGGGAVMGPLQSVRVIQ